MKIMYVASEVAPFIKTGGLGDVAGSLPKALAAKGHEVKVFCPLYSAIKPDWREKFTYLKNAYVRLGWRNQYCGVFQYELDGVDYYFIDNEYYFARAQIYGEYDDAERFAYFSKAVLEILPDIDFKPDIINCNDWQTALVPVYYNLMFAARPYYWGIKTVFTIHNIQYQGQYGREILEYVLGVDDAHFRSGFMAMDGDVNLMKSAIVASTAVTTVSPTYAQEIQTAYYGHRLDSVLRANSYKLHGILNGIDMETLDPMKDPALFANYGPKKPEGKLENKKQLLELCGLEGGEGVPVIGMVSRFADHKGFDLLEAVLDDLLQEDVRLIVLGKGEWRYEQMFLEAKRRYPDKISASIMFSGELAQRIYAGSDIFLMPSKSEPCGLAQMISLRYGTIPVVRETGGLRDTVTAFVDYLGTGNGFTFASYNAHDMLHVIREACEVFRCNKPAWKKLVQNGMESDFSWDTSADQYLELYQSL
ncbi:glycogen synthase GlgA [Clostridiaceae bacterium]|nr:glycogen synthase GlgA [Clostridiaceae bacterium]